MTSTTAYLQLKKHLDQAALKLKSEFIGIDNVIDEIIDSIASWHFFPDIQEKPLVINLWGMTGVGKTDLVRRLAYHLNFQDALYEFDLGRNASSRYEIEGKLEDIFSNEDNFPVIIAFDEFQLGRTITEQGSEIDRSSLRIIWELIDSGRIRTTRSFMSYERIYDLRNRLQHLLNEGVKVRNGIVIGGLSRFRKAFDLPKEYDDLGFIQRSNYDDLYELLRGKLRSDLVVEAELLSLNGPESIDYLAKALKHVTTPKLIDLSKSLIFILGNLDEAFTMSHDFDGDIDADQFHRLSLKVDIPIIKKALQRRFRNEQIARLGSNHIIYPAFSKQNFRDIIDLKINNYLVKISKRFNMDFSADASLQDMIYTEGVFPVQGIRPVLSCIDQNIKAKMGTIMTKFFISGKKADAVSFASAGSNMMAIFYLKGKIQMEIIEEIQQKVRLLKKNNRDDQQALISVHEAGHAVISMVLLNVYPEEIFSQAMDSERMGFMYANFKWDVFPRKLMMNRVAYYLAGNIAEEIVFGKDMVTAGSSVDLANATAFVTDMIRRQGLGKLPATLQTNLYKAPHDLHDDEHNAEIKDWLNNAKNLTKSVLYTNFNLLITLSDYLSDHRTIKKSKIEKLVKETAPEVAQAIERFESYHRYREVLKEKVENAREGKNVMQLTDVQSNKGKNQ